MTERLLRTAQLWLVGLTVLLTDRWTAMRARADRDRDPAATRGRWSAGPRRSIQVTIARRSSRPVRSTSGVMQ